MVIPIVCWIYMWIHILILCKSIAIILNFSVYPYHFGIPPPPLVEPGHAGKWICDASKYQSKHWEYGNQPEYF